MREIEYLKSMYPPGIKMLQNYVSEACDRMDYQNSPMYDEYPDGMMVNRICRSICDTVLSVEGVETIEKMWNIREDKVKTEELSLEDTSIQSVPGWEEMPEDFHIRHKLPDQAVYESQELINCISNDPMEVQMVRHQDSSWMENNRSNGGRPPMPPRPTPPGPSRPPMPPRPTPPGPNRQCRRVRRRLAQIARQCRRVRHRLAQAVRQCRRVQHRLAQAVRRCRRVHAAWKARCTAFPITSILAPGYGKSASFK